MPRSPRGRRALVLALGLAVLAIGGLAAVLLGGDEGDVSNPGVQFDESDRNTKEAPSRSRAGRHPADDGFSWPQYGYTKARTHVLPVRRQLRPPFKGAWAVRGSILLEFTPVICGRSLYLLKNNGALYAISRTSGEVRWKRKLGYLAASSPACGHGSVYSVLLQRGKGVRKGRIVSVNARTGKERWRRDLPSRAESSPLLDRGRLYFGSENGTVYALKASDGSVRWTYKADGAVKGGLALDSGRLFFGDYGGKVHGIRRADGSRIWRSSGSDQGIGRGAGNFYSTPAVAYGRVFIGNTDSNVYSFSAADGKLAWRKGTGDFVYASPAVGQVKGGGPTVWIGSYDGKFYALDARSGRTRWRRSLGRKISGGATVVGDLVFVSDLDDRRTWALGARTGVTRWRTNRGAFAAVVSDGRRIYLNGYASLFGLDTKDRRFRSRSTKKSRAEAAQRSLNRRVAKKLRQRKFREAPHGHRHSGSGPPPRCHPHKHTYKLGNKTFVLKHDHCHTHQPRNR